jgi:beta-glucosidase/6-phospho-beta-glucosidase/beta-galactosidase
MVRLGGARVRRRHRLVGHHQRAHRLRPRRLDRRVFPPGKTLAIPDALHVAAILIDAHAKAYDRIHAADTVDADGDGEAAWVTFSTHNRVFLPRTASSAADVAAAETLGQVNNLLFLEAVTHGNIDWNFDGDLDDPGDVRADPALAGRADYIALQYYGVTLVVASPGLAPFSIPLMNDLYRFGLDAPVTDFGTVIYPEGFRVVLDELRPYGLPIIVTENGLADAADVQRPRFLIDHLYAWAGRSPTASTCAATTTGR